MSTKRRFVAAIALILAIVAIRNAEAGFEIGNHLIRELMILR